MCWAIFWPLLPGELTGSEQFVHVQPVRFIGWNAPRRGKRLGKVSQLLQIAHLIADGRGRKAHARLARDRARADGHGGGDVVVDDGSQNEELSFIKTHDHAPFRSLLALNEGEC